ncbi:MAG: RedB protein [Vicinamibacterales bacterium]
MASTVRRSLVPVLGAAWLVAVGFGMRTLAAYTYTPGEPGHASAYWPAETQLARDPSRPTLVLFAHPQCPCSRAAVSELARLMTTTRGALDVRVVVLHPTGTPPGWERTDIWRAAATIPGVSVVTDEAGHEADRFGAVVSGQSYLYSASGRLLFAGGITLGRGHEGDNPGRAAVLDWVTTGHGATRGPVFGCTLQQARPADRATGAQS